MGCESMFVGGPQSGSLARVARICLLGDCQAWGVMLQLSLFGPGDWLFDSAS